MQTQSPIYVVGDIHGEIKKLEHLLKDAGLLGNNHSWSGGTSELWFLGDFVDRGPDGIAVIDLVMRLQEEAAAAGGKVSSLMGNHELLLLGAYRFGRRSTGLGSNFIAKWKQNGGNRKDIAGLKPHHLEWLAQLPLMANVHDHLFLHADAPFYIRYGKSVEEVNAAARKILKGSDALAWEEFIEDFARRGAFQYTSSDLLQRFLNIYGGQQIVHGHTPINTVLGCSAKKVTSPLIYADGKCVNVDGGMCLGGVGFAYKVA